MNRTEAQLRISAARRGQRPLVRLPRHCRPGPADRAAVHRMKRGLRELGLVTVCEEARCPNLAPCFSRGTATFMLLGDVCTRTCRFCAVATGVPRAVDASEPDRVADAVARLGLAHCVLTSVNRDDLADGGAEQSAATLRAIRARRPGVTLEVLTPDFKGDARSLATVLAAEPDVFNHNVETVPRLYSRVRPGARFERSLAVLETARALAGRRLLTKSGLMLGLGETLDEVHDVLRALRARDVDALTLGQYLRPSLQHLEVARYLEPEEFDALAAEARDAGFVHVASGPLVRSSFRADALRPLLDKCRAR